jgi:hypothetical protein
MAGNPPDYVSQIIDLSVATGASSLAVSAVGPAQMHPTPRSRHTRAPSRASARATAATPRRAAERAGVQTPHTAVVGFETTASDYKKLQALTPAQRRAKIARWAIGGAAGVGVVAGVAVALTFGSLASTVANTPVGDAMMAVGDSMDPLAGLGGAGGADCCGGDCCGGHHDCGECGHACAVC